MLRDDGSNGGGRRRSSRNVLGEPLDICSVKPMAGFYRDGCCNTGREDVGSHTVCAVMTSAFLEFSKSRGNDLSTPVPAFGFPGLNPGDRWCLCAPRWQELIPGSRRACLLVARCEFCQGLRHRAKAGRTPWLGWGSCLWLGTGSKPTLSSNRNYVFS
jgi:uncharacterized protein